MIQTNEAAGPGRKPLRVDVEAGRALLALSLAIVIGAALALLWLAREPAETAPDPAELGVPPPGEEPTGPVTVGAVAPVSAPQEPHHA